MGLWGGGQEGGRIGEGVRCDGSVEEGGQECNFCDYNLSIGQVQQ